MAKTLIIGTRRSMLALAQSRMVADLISRAHPDLLISLKEVVTKGDTNVSASLPSIGGKGLFTAELEAELLAGSIDIAVHSLKDLPTEMPEDFEIVAVTKRVSYRDVLISSGNVGFKALPSGTIFGTSSPRREFQLRLLRPDLIFRDIRGNIDTRVKKVQSGEYAATVLAEAGLIRAGLTGSIAAEFSDAEILPAPGQGAVAVQAKSGRADLRELLSSIECNAARLETVAERSFLHALSAGCSAPVAALGTLKGDVLSLITRCAARIERVDGREYGPCIETKGEVHLKSRVASNQVKDAEELGKSLAAVATSKGFRI